MGQGESDGKHEHEMRTGIYVGSFFFRFSGVRFGVTEKLWGPWGSLDS